jgi:hypothetical protein
MRIARRGSRNLKPVPVALYCMVNDIAESGDEIMFALLAEQHGLTEATWLASAAKLKCQRTLLALRAMLRESCEGRGCKDVAKLRP